MPAPSGEGDAVLVYAALRKVVRGAVDGNEYSLTVPSPGRFEGRDG